MYCPWIVGTIAVKRNVWLHHHPLMIKYCWVSHFARRFTVQVKLFGTDADFFSLLMLLLLIVAMIDVNAMVGDVMNLIVHVVDQRSGGVGGGENDATFSKKSSELFGGDGNEHHQDCDEKNKKHEQKILLCLDSGLSLLTSLVLSTVPGETERMSQHTLALERLLDVALVQSNMESVRRVVAVNLQRVSHVPAISTILFGRRFFDHIVRERRRTTSHAIGGGSGSAGGVSGGVSPVRGKRNCCRATEYFDLLCASLSMVGTIPIRATSTTIATLLLEQPCSETFGSKIDDVFVGLCKTLYVVLSREMEDRARGGANGEGKGNEQKDGKKVVCCWLQLSIV